MCAQRSLTGQLDVLFALSWLPSSTLKLWCQPGVFLLPRCGVVQHTRCVPSGLRAQIWQTTWIEKRQCKHGYFHSFETLNTQQPLQQRGQFLPRYTWRGHRGALFSSYALALVLCNVFTPAMERDGDRHKHYCSSVPTCHPGDHPYSIYNSRIVHSEK